MRSLSSVALLFLITAAVGCGCSKTAGPNGESVSSDATKETVRDAVKESSKETTKDGAAPAKREEPAKIEPAVADAVTGTAKPIAKKQKQTLPTGVLTAGSFDDSLDPLVFNSFVQRMSQHRTLGGLPAKMQGQRLVLLVKDSLEKPVGNAKVKLTSGAGPAVELVTRSDGRVIFQLALDQLPADQPLIATATGPNGVGKATDTIPPGSPRWELTLPGVQATLPKNLDLAIVLDTTGSMGDELDYLKAEVRGISAAVAKLFPEVKQRFALTLYRDDNDLYVARTFDFTTSLDDFHTRLGEQNAGGGGDYPEAMHRGLEEANQLRWRADDTARVLFLVGDAPPHAQHLGRAVAAINNLRKKGVAVYPLAASGYDEGTELVMRSAALLTGSQFLFLTDDSGVGGAHGEPRIPYYQVERLERLMIRMISSELAGRRIDAAPADVLRTVGRKIN